MPDTSVEVRVTARMTNAILERFSESCGGRALAAQELGVSAATFSSWVHFKSSPKMGGTGRGGLSRERLKGIVLVLERETGRSFREIFPDFSKEELALLSSPVVEDRSLARQALLEYAGPRQSSLTYEMPDLADGNLTAELQAALKKLPYRQREILTLRYGLDGGDGQTLEEIASVFKVSRERVRQLEVKGIKKLREVSVSQRLVGFLD